MNHQDNKDDKQRRAEDTDVILKIVGWTVFFVIGFGGLLNILLTILDGLT